MFFLKELEHDITLEPKYLGPNLRDHLRLHLYHHLEGTCNGRHGYLIAIISIESIDQGCLLDVSGAAGLVGFRVRYRGLVLKPYKGETVDAVVGAVNKMGFFANVGPLQIFVSNHVSIFGIIIMKNLIMKRHL